MKSTEVNLKPTIAAGDTTDKNSLTVPDVSKLKQLRYEDVWPEDVHAAFMEAVALYPPMGKRRLKYYRISTHENEHSSNANRTKSFGRCQLIQSYILERTGKNRSRKQVSSHLQRLKKIHKDNPAMYPLFSERSQLSSGNCPAPQATTISSQDILTNISVSTRHLKDDLNLVVNLQNSDIDAISSAIVPYALEASSFNGGSCDTPSLSTNFHDQASTFFPEEFLSPILQQFPAGDLHPPDNDYFSELQDSSLLKDTINEGLRSGPAFNAPAFSISMRRLASKPPIQSLLMNAGPTMQFSRALHSPGFQTTHQWTSHDSFGNDVFCSPRLTSAKEVFHTSLRPLQLDPSEKQRLDPGRPSPSEWIWQKNHDLLLDSGEGTFSEIRLHYPPTIYQYGLPRPEARVNTLEPLGSPPEDEISQLTGGISHSYALTSPTTVTRNVLNESSIDFHTQYPEPSENLASPPVIRPAPVYPISYNHSNIHSNDRMPTSNLTS